MQNPPGREHSEQRRRSRRPGQAPQAAPSPIPGSAIPAPGGRTEAEQQPEVAWPRRTTGVKGRPAAGQCGDGPAAPRPNLSFGGSPWGAETPAAAAPLEALRQPLPAARHDPPLADPPEPCRGSGTGDEFRRATRAADRGRTPSTIRTHLAGLGRWAGPGRDPRALATPTRRRGFWWAGPGPQWVSAPQPRSAPPTAPLPAEGPRPTSPPGFRPVPPTRGGQTDARLRSSE